MSKEINIAEAKDWSDEELQDNLTYLSSRGRDSEINQIAELRGEDAAELQEMAATPSDMPANADDVLEWVGDDPERAKAAYEAETAGKNRKTVIEHLEANFDFEPA